MIKAIKFELTRAFYNKRMLLAVIFGFILALAHFIVEVLPKSEHIYPDLSVPFPWNVYDSSMIFDSSSMFLHIYYFSIVIFASIPFVSSYYEDIQTGFIKNICLRMKKRQYLLAKYIAVFLSAGTAGIVPAAANILLTMTVLPAVTPQTGTGVFPIFGQTFLSEIYYQTPMLFVSLYLLIDFMFAGVIGCMALVFSKIFNHKYLVFFSPFIVYFSVHAVFPLFALEKLDLVLMLSPVSVYEKTWGLLIGEYLVLFIISFLPFYWRGCADDVI